MTETVLRNIYLPARNIYRLINMHQRNSFKWVQIETMRAYILKGMDLTQPFPGVVEVGTCVGESWVIGGLGIRDILIDFMLR